MIYWCNCSSNNPNLPAAGRIQIASCLGFIVNTKTNIFQHLHQQLSNREKIQILGIVKSTGTRPNKFYFSLLVFHTKSIAKKKVSNAFYVNYRHRKVKNAITFK